MARRSGLCQYEAAFVSNDIDAEVLGELTGDDLDGLGVSSIGHRRKLPTAIGKLGKKIDPESRALLAPDAAVRQREAERRS
jgi:hypothetical protein